MEEEITELPEGFVFHADSMVPIWDLMNDYQQEALELFIEEHDEELRESFRESDPDIEEDWLEWIIEDFTFEILFPDLAKKKSELEYSLALIAYKNRGLGASHEEYLEEIEKEESLGE